ncbi:MAG TPA: hypothetical protein VMF61_00205 [Candidatus Acidoferrales bacterium]|nr:hypothetical protein [Candidatus Acidoferrales bacterium]
MRELVEMYYLFDHGLILDDAKLRTRLGHVRKTPFADGVRRTIDWMMSEKSAAAG